MFIVIIPSSVDLTLHCDEVVRWLYSRQLSVALMLWLQAHVKQALLEGHYYADKRVVLTWWLLRSQISEKMLCKIQAFWYWAALKFQIWNVK